MIFEQTPEFRKDAKQLGKKWRSLADDIAAAQQLIEDVYTSTDQRELFQQKFFNNKRATKLVVGKSVEIVKMRLDVQSLGVSDKARVVFVFVKTDASVIFVEVYANNEKPREDPKRFKSYL